MLRSSMHSLSANFHFKFDIMNLTFQTRLLQLRNDGELRHHCVACAVLLLRKSNPCVDKKNLLQHKINAS